MITICEIIIYYNFDLTDTSMYHHPLGTWKDNRKITIMRQPY